jgi:hypothetical protein
MTGESDRLPRSIVFDVPLDLVNRLVDPVEKHDFFVALEELGELLVFVGQLKRTASRYFEVPELRLHRPRIAVRGPRRIENDASFVEDSNQIFLGGNPPGVFLDHRVIVPPVPKYAKPPTAPLAALREMHELLLPVRSVLDIDAFFTVEYFVLSHEYDVVSFLDPFETAEEPWIVSPRKIHDPLPPSRLQPPRYPCRGMGGNQIEVMVVFRVPLIPVFRFIVRVERRGTNSLPTHLFEEFIWEFLEYPVVVKKEVIESLLS